MKCYSITVVCCLALLGWAGAVLGAWEYANQGSTLTHNLIIHIHGPPTPPTPIILTIPTIPIVSTNSANVTANILLREKRDLEDAKHGYTLNAWWRQVNYSAFLNQFTNCYACTHMPTTAGNADLWLYSTTRKRTKCIMELAMHPGDRSNIDNADYSVPLNFSRHLARNHVC